MNQQDAPRGLEPKMRVEGQIAVPGSKSVAQRALLLAALGPGGSRLRGVFEGADVEHMLQTLGAMGLGPERSADGDLVWPKERKPDRAGQAEAGTGAVIGVGESGTAARLWTALAGLGCLGPGPWTVESEGSLSRRRSPALLACLKGAGVALAPRDPGRGDFPLEIRPPAVERPGRGPDHPLGPLVLRAPGSSQEVTGLLLGMALGRHAGPLSVHGEIPSRPYVDITRDVLQRFGVRLVEGESSMGASSLGEARNNGEALHFHCSGELRAPAHPLAVEPDASAAAVALAAGCLSGGRVLVAGLSAEAAQGDVAIADHLAAFGCRSGFDGQGIWAEGQPAQGARLDLSGEPDLAPVLAAVAAAAARRGGGGSELTGLATLAGKESDRVQVLAAGLRATGFQVEAGASFLRIDYQGPGTDENIRPQPRVLDPHGDHRMAFAFGLLGLVVPGVRVSNPDCVTKSWPRFWTSLGNTGEKPAT